MALQGELERQQEAPTSRRQFVDRLLGRRWSSRCDAAASGHLARSELGVGLLVERELANFRRLAVGRSRLVWLVAVFWDC